MTKNVISLINESEAKYVKAVLDITNTIIKKEIKFIALVGPTSSGKTTTAKIIKSKLEELGKDVVQVSLDDFFKEIPADVRSADADFDSPNSMDNELFSTFMKLLISEKECEIPIFEFSTSRRIGVKKIQPKANDIYLIEGIQCFYPKIRSEIPKDRSLSLYVSVFDNVKTMGVEFSPEEIRFLRRVVRDYYYRGASAEFSARAWKNVRNNEINHIYPYMFEADVRISSLLDYEVNMMKNVFLDIIKDKDRRNYEFLDKIAKKLEIIDSIELAFLPESSLLNEFLGRAKEEKYVKKNN